jgi:hypothetical protein
VGQLWTRGVSVFFLVLVTAISPSTAQTFARAPGSSASGSSSATRVTSAKSAAAAQDPADFPLTEARIYTAEASRHMCFVLNSCPGGT